MAASTDEVLPPLAWLARAPHPAIAIAMGPSGVATRLLAPRFPAAFLTFASLTNASAPGQIHVRDLIDLYGFQHIERADPLLALLTPDPVPWEQVHRYRRAMSRRFSHGHPWLLPIPVKEIHAGLLLSLQLARVSGVLRLPGMPLSPELPAYGFDSQAHAWDLASSPPRQFFAAPDPDAVMAFFFQGN
jgi:hypothetical protein